MKKILLIVTGFFLIGCGAADYERIRTEIRIPESKKEQAKQFTIRLVKEANPKSDEEPEDNIREAYKTACYLYGEVIWGIQFVSKGNIVGFLPYDKCTPKQRKKIDNYRFSIPNTGQ